MFLTISENNKILKFRADVRKKDIRDQNQLFSIYKHTCLIESISFITIIESIALVILILISMYYFIWVDNIKKFPIILSFFMYISIKYISQIQYTKSQDKLKQKISYYVSMIINEVSFSYIISYPIEILETIMNIFDESLFIIDNMHTINYIKPLLEHFSLFTMTTLVIMLLGITIPLCIHVFLQFFEKQRNNDQPSINICEDINYEQGLKICKNVTSNNSPIDFFSISFIMISLLLIIYSSIKIQIDNNYLIRNKDTYNRQKTKLQSTKINQDVISFKETLEPYNKYDYFRNKLKGNYLTSLTYRKTWKNTSLRGLQILFLIIFIIYIPFFIFCIQMQRFQSASEVFSVSFFNIGKRFFELIFLQKTRKIENNESKKEMILSIFMLLCVIISTVFIIFSNITTSIQNMIDKYIEYTDHSLILGFYLHKLCYEILTIEPMKINTKPMGENGIYMKNMDLDIGDQNIFKNINLYVKPGMLGYLCGESGAGKTSFLNILMKLYRPTKGYYRLNKKEYEHGSNDILILTQTPILHGETIQDSFLDEKLDIQLAKKLINYFNKQFNNFWVIETPLEILTNTRDRQICMLLNLVYKKIKFNSSLILMDEPFSQMSGQEQQNAFVKIVNKYLRDKKTIILVTDHKGICTTKMNPDKFIFIGSKDGKSRKEVHNMTRDEVMTLKHVIKEIPGILDSDKEI